jgi:hypothetical protein
MFPAGPGKNEKKSGTKVQNLYDQGVSQTKQDRNRSLPDAQHAEYQAGLLPGQESQGKKNPRQGRTVA